MAKPKVLESDGQMGETQEQLTARQQAASDLPAPIPLKPKSTRALQPNRVQAAEIARNHWHATVPADASKEELLRSSFWQHYTRELRRGDLVTVMAEDNSFRAELIVRAVGPKDAALALLNFWNLDPIAPDAFEIPAGHRVEWGGELSHWRVLRQGEQGRWETLRDGHETRGAAQAWLAEHIKAMR